MQIEPQTLGVDGLSLRSLCPITQSQPGKTAGVAGYAMPEARIHDYAGSDQAGGFCADRGFEVWKEVPTADGAGVEG